MGLELVAIAGPQSGQTFNIANGLKIGRRRCEIILDDAGVSTLHAEIVGHNDKYTIRDLNSKNGLLVKGERQTEVALTPGVILQIGTGLFEVRVLETTRAQRTKVVQKQGQDSQVFEFAQIELENTSSPPVIPEITFRDKLREIAAGLENKANVLVPFETLLTLTFVAGLQTETVWTLTYGPRSCGAGSLDLTIYEPGAPDICFEIVPTPRGLELKTGHKNIVKVNGDSNSLHVLKKGDIITILNSKLEVDFIYQ